MPRLLCQFPVCDTERFRHQGQRQDRETFGQDDCNAWLRFSANMRITVRFLLIIVNLN